MRGISFKTCNCNQDIIWTILSGIEIEKLWWHISEDEIYNKLGQSIFENSYINGKTFLDIIQGKNYNAIFANIEAYPTNSKFKDINNYMEFLNSECQLVLFCVDVIYYEIYAKEDSVIEIIKNNAIKNNFYDIEYTTKENDGRTVFSVN